MSRFLPHHIMIRSNLLLILVLVIAASHFTVGDDCKGCVPLDSYSFDKVIPRFKAALVKFDVAFPYGGKHEQYASVAADTKDSQDLLIATVGVKDFGNKDNSDLAQRYNIKKDDFPVVLLFVQGKSTPIRFTPERDSDFTGEYLKRFIRSRSRVYLGLPGCVERLDRLAEEFKAAGEQDRQEILKKARIFEETLPEEQREAAKIYVKTMEKILERGDVFVQTEETRVQGLLYRGKLSDQKKRTMEERRNILQSFSARDEL
ncbi:endoplasmic reticulum resident protein 29 [Temnothorax nylanderi]|uniref:endoplasmic reticulum resident protein 29 n=1 Tax=Temnothorax nylanderi TaxID=102681 RepID=UPI003A86CE3F